MNDSKKKHSRRELFRTCGRVGTLASLGALGIMAARGKEDVGESPCVNMGICAECGRFDGCSLPQALLRRDFLRRQQRG